MIKRVIKQLDEHTEEYFIGVLLIAMTIVMLFQVVLRYVFNAALSWPEEFCRYTFIYMTFLTIGYCVQHDSFLKLDLIQKALPKTAGEILNLVIWLTCLAFFTYMFFNSISLVQSVVKSGRASPSTGIPYYVIYASTVLGFGLGIIRTVQCLIRLIREFGNRGAKEEVKA